MSLTTRTFAALLMFGVSAPALAQDDEPERLGVEDMIPGAGQGPQQEMIELFQAVERRLKGMGSFLLDAGAGDSSKLTSVEAAGIEELLKHGQSQPTGGLADLLAASEAEGERVLEDIDRILELAQQNGGT